MHVGGLSAIVVDDELDLLVLYSAFLRQQGFTVTTATTANEALLKVQDETFDLMLADVHLPVMSGLVLTQAARKISPGTFIVVMTFRSDVTEEIVKELGAHAFFDKAVGLDGLRQILLTSSESSGFADLARSKLLRN